MATRNLVERWLTTDGRRIVSQVKDSLLNNSAMRSLLSITPDGLLDLRHCPINFEYGARIQNLHLENADLSSAKMGHLVMENCIFTNCKFDNSAFEKYSERSCKFEDVSFRSVDFKGGAMGLFCSRYKKVDFSKSDLRGVSFYTPQFVTCVFDESKLTRVDFGASNFVDCTFAGRLKSIWFNRYYRFSSDEQRWGESPENEMRNVDFSRASLWDVMFTGGLDLSTVKLPTDGNHILVYRYDLALLNIAKELESFPASSRRNVELWINAAKEKAVTQPMKIVNKAEAIKHMGKDSGELFVEKIIENDRGYRFV